MTDLTTTLMLGPKPRPSTMKELEAAVALPSAASMIFMVYQITYMGDLYYCCWSGGELHDGQPQLTPVGSAALEALASIPFGSNETLVIKHLKIGPTPLREKVEATLRRIPPLSKVCFFGDLQGELDGHMEQAFNVQKGTVRI